MVATLADEEDSPHRVGLLGLADSGASWNLIDIPTLKKLVSSQTMEEIVEASPSARRGHTGGKPVGYVLGVGGKKQPILGVMQCLVMSETGEHIISFGILEKLAC